METDYELLKDLGEPERRAIAVVCALAERYPDALPSAQEQPDRFLDVLRRLVKLMSEESR